MSHEVTDLDLLDPIWRALANPVRRRILDALRDGPRTTGQLAEGFPELSRFAVMQHLGVLEEADLVLVRRQGRQRFNHLNAVPLRQIYERWVSGHAGAAAQSALQLKRFVERDESKEVPAMGSQAGRVVQIETEIRLAAPQEKVFRAITTELDEWWAFRFRPGARVVFEPWVGGRCFEDWGDGQGALYGTVVYWEPPYKFGEIGPGAMAGAYTAVDWETVEAQGDSSIYRKSLTLWGDVPEETEQKFREGTRLLMEQFLRAYVEEGRRYDPPTGR